jgi:hypothetical protein
MVDPEISKTDPVWGQLTIISQLGVEMHAYRSLREENHECEASLGYIVSLSQAALHGKTLERERQRERQTEKERETDRERERDRQRERDR